MKERNLIREKCESAVRGDGRTREVRSFGRCLCAVAWQHVAARYISSTLERCGIDPKSLPMAARTTPRQQRSVVINIRAERPELPGYGESGPLTKEMLESAERVRAPKRSFHPFPKIAGWWGVRDGELVFFDADFIR